MTLDPLAAELLARRLDIGLTQRELADGSGINQSMICSWETGKSVPRLTSARKWAAALGMRFVLVNGRDP